MPLRKILFLFSFLFLTGLPVSALNQAGGSVMGAADVTKIKPGLEVNMYFFGIAFFYNYYDKMDYIKNSKLYEFGNNLYSYKVRGKRDVFGVRWDFFNWLDTPGSSNSSAVYVGFGRNTIKGEMTIYKISADNNTPIKETIDVDSDFTLDTYMFGLFAKNISRVAIDFRLRYDVASIPIIDENTRKKRSGKTLYYTDLYPELLIGWSY